MLITAVYRIASGQFDGLSLDGLNFLVVIHSPGPMADGNMTVGLIVDERPVAAQRDAIGATYEVVVPGLVDQAIDGLPSAPNPAEPIAIDNVFRPVNTRLALAKASRGYLHAFGIDWDDTTGRTKGHYAPFAWHA